MKSENWTEVEVDPQDVMLFAARPRNQEEFARSVEDTRQRGQIVPGEIRDIRHWPAEERRRPDGGLYKYQIVVGQGRLERAILLGRKFRANLVTRSEPEAVGRFITENMGRLTLPWYQKAQLIKGLVEAGVSDEDIAKRHSITTGHVKKLRRVLDKTAKGLEREVGTMSINEAEEFTALPEGEQRIVLAVFHETKSGGIREIMKRAQKVVEEKGEKTLSKTALKKSIERTDDDLKRLRERLKLTRLHWSLGPQNVTALLQDKKFTAAAQKAGVNFKKFLAVTES